MIEAYKNYDSSYGTKFTTYAYSYILGSISEYVRENRQIKLSKDINQLKIRIDKTKILLAQNLMKIPTNEEISNFSIPSTRTYKQNRKLSNLLYKLRRINWR